VLRSWLKHVIKIKFSDRCSIQVLIGNSICIKFGHPDRGFEICWGVGSETIEVSSDI
jgi:hypothetical protein